MQRTSGMSAKSVVICDVAYEVKILEYLRQLISFVLLELIFKLEQNSIRVDILLNNLALLG